MLHINVHKILTDEVTVRDHLCIPAGTYDASLQGVTEQVHGHCGMQWVWHWRIPEVRSDAGDFRLEVWTPPHLSSSGMACEQAKALGALATNGARVDLGDLCGRRARLVVTLDEATGNNRVVGVLPPVQPAGSTVEVAVDPDYLAWCAERMSESAGGQARDDATPAASSL